jgi:heptosyltransferase-3
MDETQLVLHVRYNKRLAALEPVQLKLLIVMPTKYLGNMVIALQTIASLLDVYGEDAVLLIDENFEPLLRHIFPGRRFIGYPRRGKGPNHYISFLRSLRKEMFDLALDIDGTVLSGRITRLCRARNKSGPGFAKRTGAYSSLVPIDRDTQHCFDDFTLMAKHIDVEVSPRRYLEIPPVPANVWESDLPERRIVCIHPCATKDYKQWDISRFAELADTFIRTGWDVVIIGAGASEQSRVEKLLSLMEETPTNLHGRLDLMQVVYLLQHAWVFIGNDSGPMHLAAASGVNVLALFGPTELLRWEPMAPQVTIIKGELPCSPECRPEACLRDYQCLGSLTVAQVLQAIEQRH